MRKLLLLLTAMATLVVAAPASAATTAQATITKRGFVPAPITINAGDAVRWTNGDTANHQMVNLNGKVISPVLKPGETFTKTFLSPGTYRYMDADDDTMRTVVTVRPAAPQAVTLSASTSAVTYGGTFTLSGSVSSHQAGEDVTIYAQRYGETSYSPIATASTDDGGGWNYVAKPTIQTSYQARWRSAESDRASVGVRPLVTLRTLAGVRLFSTRVVAQRSFAGRTARFQRRNSAGQWITIKFVRLGANSGAAFRARVPHGTSALRVFFSVNQAGAGYLSGISRTVIYHRA
jgi:plastocyanin